jgi:hypothetical protein
VNADDDERRPDENGTALDPNDQITTPNYTEASDIYDDLPLLPQHRKLLKDSAIDPDVVREREYHSVGQKSNLLKLKFAEYQCRVPGLLVPIWDTKGKIATYQFRPDDPRCDASGKLIKYESPAGSSLTLDVPPSVRPMIRDPKIPLYITEGARKADAAATKDLACVAILGVWGWKGTNEAGGKTALADWEDVALNDRRVYIVFDSDVMTKPSVRAALVSFRAYLVRRGARVEALLLPAGPNGEKTGLDDFFAAGHSVEDLLKLERDGLEPSNSREPILVKLSTVVPKEVQYLWPPYLARGKLTLLEGDPDAGKTWITLAVAATVSRGGRFPNGYAYERSPESVVILSVEDGIEDTIVPRLKMLDADLERITAIPGCRSYSADGRTREVGISLADVQVLDEAMSKTRPSLVVIDPIQGFMPNVDIHRANEVRPVLADLVKLAEKYGCSVLAVRHLSKAPTGRAAYRGMGSIDFTAAARSVLLAGVHPKTGQRALVHLKSNLAPKGASLGYKLDSQANPPFSWTGEQSITADDLLAPVEQGGSKLTEAIAFLQTTLADGEHEAVLIESQAMGKGISRATLKRARSALGVMSRQHEGTQGWFWSLPPDEKQTNDLGNDQALNSEVKQALTHDEPLASDDTTSGDSET